MYSRRNKEHWEEYPYSIPPRYSGSRFRRSDGREETRIFSSPEFSSEDCLEDILDKSDECVCSEAETGEDISENTPIEQCDGADDTAHSEDKAVSDIFGSLLGSEELLIIGVIILLTIYSEDGDRSSVSDIVPILALLLLLK